VEILKSISIDWLRKKWFFFISSWVIVALGVVGYVVNDGLVLGIDFTGGTVAYLKFRGRPELDRIRKALESESATPPTIQTYGPQDENTVQVRMQKVYGGSDVQAGEQQILNSLRKVFDSEHLNSSQTDFNNVKSVESLSQYLLSADPDSLKNQKKTIQEIEDYYRGLAQKIKNYRDNNKGGLVDSLDDLKNVSGLSNSDLASLKQGYYAGPVASKGLTSIGAVVGSDLRRRAVYAIGFSFLGMLIYIGFRFKPIYGVAAVFAVVHDVTITIGLFALTRKEISLTVIAALLTLIGYSMNDTIVIFDRARENLRLLRKESLYNILNLSINQTLARTIITSGFTFLAVFSLFLFGGEVLNGFSFALVVGIIIGTYSTIGIASPIVEWWYRSVAQKSK
jgi:preprotein translocase subunit SecF